MIWYPPPPGTPRCYIDVIAIQYPGETATAIIPYTGRAIRPVHYEISEAPGLYARLLRRQAMIRYENRFS